MHRIMCIDCGNIWLLRLLKKCFIISDGFHAFSEGVFRLLAFKRVPRILLNVNVLCSGDGAVFLEPPARHRSLF
jgi:hypothetical protein